MIMTKDHRDHTAVILLPGDLSLLIKALDHYSRFLDKPELEERLYHCDSMRNAFGFWLLNQNLEYLSHLVDIEKARLEFDKQVTPEVNEYE